MDQGCGRSSKPSTEWGCRVVSSGSVRDTQSCLLKSQQNHAHFIQTIKNSIIPISQKKILTRIAESEKLTKKSRIALARKFVDKEEDKISKTLEKTDIITRIGPTLGLMGTLIPMGPGLAALGTGDVTTLSQAIIVAFNTTVVGIGSGAIAYVVSKIRRRWYDEYLSNLDTLSDVVLDKIEQFTQEE